MSGFMRVGEALVTVAQWAFMVLVIGPAVILFPWGLGFLFILNGWAWRGYLTRLWYMYWGLVLFSLIMLSIGTAWEAFKRKE
jgi:hypothetical protein